jgi:hypothetical protein
MEMNKMTHEMYPGMMSAIAHRCKMDDILDTLTQHERNNFIVVGAAMEGTIIDVTDDLDFEAQEDLFDQIKLKNSTVETLLVRIGKITIGE